MEPEGKIGSTSHRRLTEAINKDPTVGAAAGGDKRSFTLTNPLDFLVRHLPLTAHPLSMQYPMVTERYQTGVHLDMLNA